MAKRKTLLVFLTRLDDDKLNVWDGDMHRRATRKSCRCGRLFKSKVNLKRHVSRWIKKKLEKNWQVDKISRLSRYHCSLIDKAIKSNLFSAQYYHNIAMQDDAARQVEKSTTKLNYPNKFKRESSDLLSYADAHILDQTCGNSLLGKPALTVSNSLTQAKSDPESISHRKVTVSIPNEQCNLKPFISYVTKVRQCLESKKEAVKSLLTLSTKPVEMDISCSVNRDFKSLLEKTSCATSNSSTQAESGAESACCRNVVSSFVEPCVRDVARMRQLTEGVAKNSVVFSTKPVEMDLRSPSANLNCFIRLNISLENALGNPVRIGTSNNEKDGDATNDDADTSSPNINQLKVCAEKNSSRKGEISAVGSSEQNAAGSKNFDDANAMKNRHASYKHAALNNRFGIELNDDISSDSSTSFVQNGIHTFSQTEVVGSKQCARTNLTNIQQRSSKQSNQSAKDAEPSIERGFRAINSSGEVCAEENLSRKREISAAGSSEQTAAGSKSFDDSNAKKNRDASYKHSALNNGFGMENDDISNDSSISSVQNGIHPFPQTGADGSKQCARTNVMNIQLWSSKESNQSTKVAEPSVELGFHTRNEMPTSFVGRNVQLNVDSATRSPSEQNCVPQIPCIDLTDDIDFKLDNVKDVPSWSCNNCNISFLSEEFLQQHVLRTHTTLKCYVCGQWIWGTNNSQNCMLHTHQKPPRPCCETSFSKVAGHKEKVCSQHHFAKDAVLILAHHVKDKAPKSNCVSNNPSSSLSHGNVDNVVTEHQGINSSKLYAQAKRSSYKCSQCDNAFKKKEYLKVHIYKFH